MTYTVVQNSADQTDFRKQANYGLALIAVVLLTPFAINNFLQSRYVLGAGSAIIIILLALNAWSIKRGQYRPTLIYYFLTPAVLFFLALAFHNQGIVGAFWCYPSILAFYCILPVRRAWLANAALLLVALPSAWYYLDIPIASRIVVTLIAVSAFAALLIHIITSQQRQLQLQIVTDPLTSLFNRTLLKPTLEQAMQQSQRTDIPMTLLAIDLDNFKIINDTLGHDAGDTVLRGIGSLLSARLRRSDTAFRTGGEEFVALLYGANATNGLRVAETLREAIATHPLLLSQPVTASIGVATLVNSESSTDWTKRADKNLYQAKAAGRNRVVA